MTEESARENSKEISKRDMIEVNNKERNGYTLANKKGTDSRDSIQGAKSALNTSLKTEPPD